MNDKEILNLINKKETEDNSKELKRDKKYKNVKKLGLNLTD